MSKKELVEVQGIFCEVKDPSKKSLVEFCQNILRIETDKYIGEQIMTDKRRGYASALEINIKIVPFVLGWLKRPGEDEYRVITGRMSLEVYNKKNKPIKPSTKSTKIAPSNSEVTIKKRQSKKG